MTVWPCVEDIEEGDYYYSIDESGLGTRGNSAVYLYK